MATSTAAAKNAATHAATETGRLDPDAQLAAILQEAGTDADGQTLRKVAVVRLRETLKAGRDDIAALIERDPFSAKQAHARYAALTDAVVIATLRLTTGYLHPLQTPTKSERLALVAVGGYGRGEMAPFSDVDLLFLTPYKITPWAESVIESMLYMLWDLHLKVGHSSRTVQDCLRLAKDDYTIRTALLEQRFLAGDKNLSFDLERKLQRELFSGSAIEFIEAKLNERAERHGKQGGQRYVVEPNVKEGKGGLRDLQSMFWIQKYVLGVRDTNDLVRRKVFTNDEFARLNAAEAFLMAVRTQLHLIAGRAVEQLTFDMQVEVANRLGYRDHGGRRAVEHFMQDYFRHANAVGELTRIFLTSLEDEHLKKEPRLAGLLHRKRKVRPEFIVAKGRLVFADRKTAMKDPLNILRLFEEALRTGYLIHPDDIRLAAANLHLIDDKVRNDLEANRIFFDMLLKHGNPERALRRMNEVGILAAFIPEFQPVVAMMQFNMYHSYTVDEHTIQCISNLAQIERGELHESLPIASGILKRGINRKVLYVALLAHDLGKGQDEDHSILGARLARNIAQRMRLRPKEIETVEWLVRYHLLMSDVAQKRDLADPRTIRGFAKAVRTREQLDLLTVLTVCDIRGVGPDTWNNWKAVLLRNLYRQTATALEDGVEALNLDARENEAKRALRAALSDWPAKELRAEIARHYSPYWQGLPTEVHQVIARLLRGITVDDIRIDLLPDEDRDATRACFAVADHPGLMSRIAGALSLVGANVVDARIYTSRDGYSTATFWIQDSEGHPFESSRLPRLQNTLSRMLGGEILPREAFAQRDKLKKRERPFKVTSKVAFDNDGSDIYTIIEVESRDRPGLLYDLTRCLAENNVYVASAVIATYGELVVDAFYVKDMFGLKFHSESRRRALERRIIEAIQRGADRAEA